MVRHLSLVFALLVGFSAAAGPNTLGPHAQFVVNSMNATLGSRAAGQLQYELLLPSTNTTGDPTLEYNKLLFEVFLAFGLSCLGVDRCMIGQCCIGMSKLIGPFMVGVVITVLGKVGPVATLIGTFVVMFWNIADWLVLSFNILFACRSIDCFYWNIVWKPDTIMPACIVAWLWLCCQCGGCILNAAAIMAILGADAGKAREVAPEDADEDQEGYGKLVDDA